MINVKTERDYLIKVVNYKGNIVAKIKFPKSKRETYNVIVNVVRLYERAKNNSFLTSALLKAIKKTLQTFYDTKVALHLLLKNPYLNKAIKQILSEEEENYQEDIIVGKIREQTSNFLETCSICRCLLKKPAFVVFTKNGKVIKKSRPIGIKCLNRTTEKLQELVTYIQTLDNLTEDSKSNNKTNEKTKSLTEPQREASKRNYFQPYFSDSFMIQQGLF